MDIIIMDKKYSKSKAEYLEKLKDPRWQQMRLKVFERDEWTCQCCYNNTSTLNVHHRYYLENKEPWEYPIEAFITLCESCHREEQENRFKAEQNLLFALKERFLTFEVEELCIGIHNMPMRHAPELVASAYRWALETPEVQDELLERYVEGLRQKNRLIGSNDGMNVPPEGGEQNHQ
jgi:hypothetical protein